MAITKIKELLETKRKQSWVFSCVQFIPMTNRLVACSSNEYIIVKILQVEESA